MRVGVGGDVEDRQLAFERCQPLRLERRPESEVTPPPDDNADWWARRAETRGISLDDIL